MSGGRPRSCWGRWGVRNVSYLGEISSDYDPTLADPGRNRFDLAAELLCDRSPHSVPQIPGELTQEPELGAGAEERRRVGGDRLPGTGSLTPG